MDELTPQQQALLEEALPQLGLSERTINGLERAGIFTVQQLLGCTPASILLIPNFGKKVMEEIYTRLEENGFYRKGHRPHARKSPAPRLRRRATR